MHIYRQGDVLIESVSTRKVTAQRLEEQGRIILAHGEVTGHAHEVVSETAAIPPATFFESNGERFLLLDAPCLLTHQEHGPIQLAPGCYRISRQREYTPERIVNVAD